MPPAQNRFTVRVTTLSLFKGLWGGGRLAGARRTETVVVTASVAPGTWRVNARRAGKPDYSVDNTFTVPSTSDLSM